MCINSIIFWVHVHAVCSVSSSLNVTFLLLISGHPLTRSKNVSHCFGRPLQLTCQHDYTTAGPVVWRMDGTRAHDGQEFAINEALGTITILNVSRSRFAHRNTSLQCCVEVRSKLPVCGELYLFDPLGKMHEFCRHTVSVLFPHLCVL